jgi:hypothetical protein
VSGKPAPRLDRTMDRGRMALANRGMVPAITGVVVGQGGSTVRDEPQNKGLQRTRPGFARSLAAEPSVIRTLRPRIGP